MNKPTSQSAPTKLPVILYGMSDGKARAAVFKGADIEPALKAAEIVKLSALQSDSDEAQTLPRTADGAHRRERREHRAVRSQGRVREAHQPRHAVRGGFELEWGGSRCQSRIA